MRLWEQIERLKRPNDLTKATAMVHAHAMVEGMVPAPCKAVELPAGTKIIIKNAAIQLTMTTPVSVYEITVHVRNNL